MYPTIPHIFNSLKNKVKLRKKTIGGGEGAVLGIF
jgi:hypothetical protein